ncbi:MAG: helix-turn-helix domain-containing protein [Marinosulfonomonas sp.]|nr:helix-turn-helix domain-containing protein [Marinosulfonomonas sp.]
MRAGDIPELQKLKLFADMTPAHFQDLIRAAYVQTFPPHVDLISEGDHGDFLHIVVSGSVELYSVWNHHETSMATVRPVSSFILAATIKNGPYLMSARTLEKSRIVLLPSIDVREIFDRDSGFARAVVRELANCYRSAVKDTKNLKLRSSLERLANYLIRSHMRSNEALVFELTIKKRRLASFLDMTPENLSRAIKSLRSYGVQIDGTRVTITDMNALLKLAKPSPLIDDYST